MQEYEIVVIGDEPAGLWLLHHYTQAMREHGGAGNLAWVSLTSDPRPHCIPSLVAQAFELQASESWNLEILSPQQNLVWNPEVLKKRFPGLPDSNPLTGKENPKLTPIDLLQKWDKNWMKQIHSALIRHPELFSLSQAVWKWMGRSLPSVSEVQFAQAYRFHDFAYWDPSQMVPKEVSRLSLNPGEHPLEDFKSHPKHSMELTFRGFGSITAKRFIWNLPWKQLSALCRRNQNFYQHLNPGVEDAVAANCLYGIRVEAEAKAAPSPMRPVSIYMDDWLIPDPHSEMWPIQLFSFGQTKELCVWANAPKEVSLEATQSAFTQALQRTYRLLPFLPGLTKSLSIGLDSDCSFNEQTRSSWFERLYQTRTELYQRTLASVGSRHSSHSLLLPAVDCHLPYPLGTLAAARKLAKEWIPKKKPADKNSQNQAHSTAQLP